MTVTVAQVDDYMRDLHPALSSSNAPDQLALRALSRFQRDLVREIVVKVPAFLSQQVAVALPLADFDAGIDLSALIPDGWTDLLDGFFRYSTAVPPFRDTRGVFAAFEQRDMPQPFPAWTFQGNVVYLIGVAEDFAQISQFTLHYTGTPAELTTDQATFVLPDDCKDYFAAALAAFHLKRLVGNPSFNVDRQTAQLYGEDAAELRLQFLSRIFRLSQRQNYSVRNVTGR